MMPSLPSTSSGREPPPRDPEKGFAQLKQAIIARTGHHYYIDKDAMLRDRLDRRLQATGCASVQDYLALLSHSAAGAAEWRELEAEITVGETFFFRHAEQFAALREVILPAILSANARTRSLRIWSAGCAVGAEPYSVAILVERLLGEAMRDWHIDIIGSDISHRALAQAREGRFSNWALRGMSEAERLRDFSLTPDRRQWRIADRHRGRVRFVTHNLLQLFEASAGDWSGFDLILCRNVLIYFHPDRIAPTLSALARCLTPSGWLMVGHSDAIAALPRDIGIVDVLGTRVFRPQAAEGLSRRAHCLAGPRHDGAWVGATPREQMTEASTPVVPSDPLPQHHLVSHRGLPPNSAAAVDTVAAIRALADTGRLTEAADAAKAAIEAHPLDPRLHFYDGVIAQARGKRTEAEAALRRAVYLCGTMVMAHYHLGLLLLDGATPEAGHRVMTQVLKLCADLAATDILPESDGLTVRGLMERVDLRLRPRRPS